nr:MAG TPA: hypothetical protein [Caudoviricetes sp.]
MRGKQEVNMEITPFPRKKINLPVTCRVTDNLVHRGTKT